MQPKMNTAIFSPETTKLQLFLARVLKFGSMTCDRAIPNESIFRIIPFPVKFTTAARYAVSTWTLIAVAYQTLQFIVSSIRRATPRTARWTNWNLLEMGNPITVLDVFQAGKGGSYL